MDELIKLAKMRDETLTCTTPRGVIASISMRISLSILPLNPTYTNPPHPPTKPTPVAHVSGECEWMREGPVGRDDRVFRGVAKGEGGGDAA